MNQIRTKYVFILAGVLFLAIAFYLTRSNYRDIRRTPRPVPRQTNIQQIASWMTVPYISRVYKTPTDVLFAAIGHNPTVTPNDSIEAIARRENKNATQLVEKLKETVAAAHEQ